VTTHVHGYLLRSIQTKPEAKSAGVTVPGRPASGAVAPLFLGLFVLTLYQKVMLTRESQKIIISGSMVELLDFRVPLEPPKKQQSVALHKDDMNQGFEYDESHPFDVSSSRAKRQLKRLAHANYGRYGERLKVITYTFKDNITDLTQAHELWRKYIQRLNYMVGKEVQYVAVTEFQKRGAIHYHAIFFNFPYIKNLHDKHDKLWGYGMVKIDTKNSSGGLPAVVRYLTKYMTKNFDDPAMLGRKRYLRSKGLFNPIQIDDPEVFHMFKSYLIGRSFYDHEVVSSFVRGDVKTFMFDEKDDEFLRSQNIYLHDYLTRAQQSHTME
jgi:hypothetical protein